MSTDGTKSLAQFNPSSTSVVAGDFLYASQAQYGDVRITAQQLLRYILANGGGGLVYTSGAPTSAVGNDGCFALDPVAGLFYGPRTLGVWPTVSYPIIANQLGPALQTWIQNYVNAAVTSAGSVTPAASKQVITRADGFIDGSFVIGSYPTVSPLFYADFRRSRVVRSAFTYTRNSVGYVLTKGAKLLQAAANVPRFSYDIASYPKGLLLEPASTNLAPTSGAPNAATSGWFVYGMSAAATTMLGPDGATSVTLFTESTTTNSVRIINPNTASAPLGLGIWCASTYIKPNGRTNFTIHCGGTGMGGQQRVVYDLVALTATTTIGTVTGSIESLANGWFQLRATFPAITTAQTTIDPPFLYMGKTAPSSTSDGLTYSGDGASGFYFFNWQLEQQLTPTTPIITASGVTGTRAADVLTLPASNFLTQQAVTILFDGHMPENLSVSNCEMLMLWDGTTSNYLSISATPATAANNNLGQLEMSMYSGGVQTWFARTNYLTKAGGYFRFALSVTSNVGNFSFNGDGTQLNASGSLVFPLNLATLQMGGRANQRFTVSRLAFYSTALSQAQLNALTA